MMSRRQPSSPSLSPASTSVEVLRRLLAHRQAARTLKLALDVTRLSRTAANRALLASGTLANVRQQIAEMSRRAEPPHAPEQTNSAPYVEAVALLRAIHAEAKSRLATPQDIEKALRAYAIDALIQDYKANRR
jgi:hypothetical protein